MNELRLLFETDSDGDYTVRLDNNRGAATPASRCCSRRSWKTTTTKTSAGISKRSWTCPTAAP